MRNELFQGSNINLHCPKPHAKTGGEGGWCYVEPHSIQNTFLSVELNAYSLSSLLHINNCKAS